MSVKAKGKMIVLLGDLSDGMYAVGPFDDDTKGFDFADTQYEADLCGYLTVYAPEDFQPNKWGDLVLERTEECS